MTGHRGTRDALAGGIGVVGSLAGGLRHDGYISFQQDIRLKRTFSIFSTFNAV
jgi:hypothetical protein